MARSIYDHFYDEVQREHPQWYHGVTRVTAQKRVRQWFDNAEHIYYTLRENGRDHTETMGRLMMIAPDVADWLDYFAENFRTDYERDSR